MSGHNKWSKIKRGKEAKDQLRGNVFSKLSRLITLAVIQGGGITDPEHNFKLRLAVEKAKQLNMPKENIKRAIDRASGPDRSTLKEIIYEAFAPGGVGLIIEATTDNPNRTLAEIRNVLERHQGKLGSEGSVSYLFQKCGLQVFNKNQVKEEQVLEFAEKINAFDIEEDDQTFSVFFPFDHLGRATQCLGDIKAQPAQIDYKPKTLVTITDKTLGDKIIGLLEALENLDDVHRVFANFDLVV